MVERDLYIWKKDGWFKYWELKGEQGNIGPQGTQGPKGDKGDVGLIIVHLITVHLL